MYWLELKLRVFFQNLIYALLMVRLNFYILNFYNIDNDGNKKTAKKNRRALIS